MKEKQNPIVEQSENEDHCVQLMEKEMDNFVDSIVKNSEFWTKVPDELIEDLKKEHAPIYRDAYVIFFYFLSEIHFASHLFQFLSRHLTFFKLIIL